MLHFLEKVNDLLCPRMDNRDENRDSNEYSESDDEDAYVNPIIDRFGKDPIVEKIAVDADAASVSKLVSKGVRITAEAVFAAIWADHKDTLKVLLDAGTSPNIRSDKATTTEITRSPPSSTQEDIFTFCEDQQEWHPLKFISQTVTRPEVVEDRGLAQTDMMQLFLDRGADAYATYLQPRRCLDRHPFPSGNYDGIPTCDHRGVNNLDDPLRVTNEFVARTVIHSIFEDGDCIQLFFDGSFKLDLEARDPQGRTILHSACRSGLGVDTVIDGIRSDVHWNVFKGGYLRDPFISSDDNPSLFEELLQCNADLHATDSHGKHILHHLLEAQDAVGSTSRPPIMGKALKYVLTHLQTLVNKPDKYGTYPIHTALQRWRRYPFVNWYTKAAGLETVVDDLLAAGADPLTCDGQGNTVLHYLADDNLTRQAHGNEIRRLFKAFLDRGVDINARNKAGRTAVELLLDDDDKMEGVRYSQNIPLYMRGNLPTVEEMQTQVFGWLEEAGVRWTETDTMGRTLLHLVAMHKTASAAFRAKFLLSKGVSPTAKDQSGRSALDLVAVPAVPVRKEYNDEMWIDEVAEGVREEVYSILAAGAK